MCRTCLLGKNALFEQDHTISFVIIYARSAREVILSHANQFQFYCLREGVL